MKTVKIQHCRKWLFGLAVAASAACSSPAGVGGDAGGGNTSTDAGVPTTQEPLSASDCLTACMADEASDLQQYCGSNRQTYGECQVLCDPLPAGVSVYQGACGADGMPTGDQPPYPADGDRVCDWFKNGNDWVAISCDEDTGGGEDTGMDATPTMGMTADAPDNVTTQALVDHRPRYGSIKDQGSAPTCIAFAATAGLEGAVFLVSGERSALSEMHLFSRYTTTRYSDMANAIRSGIATAEQAQDQGFAYSAALAARWLCANEGGGRCDQIDPVGPDEGARTTLNMMANFAVSSVDRVQPRQGTTVVTAEQLRARLDDGQDLIVGMRMNDNWYSRNLMPGGIIRDYTASRNFGHSVLLVGYTTMNDRNYFIIRNSWGTSWAQNGYGFISFENAQRHLQVAYSVAARRNTTGVSECPMGEAAALDETCRRVCPDQSLSDAMDVCHGVGAMCPENTVADPSNICVRACSSGNLAGTGFTAQCDDRGCTYAINGGTNGCRAASGRTCRQYCPAPNCGLTATMNEFGVPVIACVPNRE